jgi:NAD(P)-dependent dehydrogenase (short-subunit alcohol dehydrogenase family)
MDLGLRDRISLVTGASAGIGAAVALRLAEEGARVIICARQAQRAQRTAEEIHDKTGAEIQAVPADCTKEQDIARLVDTILSSFGRIDILVNSLAGPRDSGVLELSDQNWIDGLNVKLLSHIRCVRALLPHMMERRWGRIVNIIGTHGHQPHSFLITAGVVNAALQNFTKALAGFAAPHNIRVNTVNPGPIETERMQYAMEVQTAQIRTSMQEARRVWEEETLLKRFGKPDEVAAAVVFLVSEPASYITGATINVDGGQTRGV